MLRIKILLSATFVILLSACGGPTTSSPKNVIPGAISTLSGQITSISKDEKSILIENQTGMKTYFTVDKTTIILDNLKLKDLPGNVVEVRFNGTCAESYPQQCGLAREIKIVGVISGDKEDSSPVSERQ